MTLWLKADAIVGLSDGDPLATWEDDSGVGNDATQATSGNRPLYRTGVVNSLPAVQFGFLSGSFSRLALPNLMNGFAAGTAFFAAKLDNDPPINDSVAGAVLGDWGSATDVNHVPYSDGTIYDDFGSTTRKTAGNPATSLASWHVIAVRSGVSDWTMHVNGTLLHSTSSNTVGWGSSPQIGASGGTGHHVAGYVAEVLAYDTALGATDRQNVESYLATKYGL